MLITVDEVYGKVRQLFRVDQEQLVGPLVELLRGEDGIGVSTFKTNFFVASALRVIDLLCRRGAQYRETMSADGCDYSCVDQNRIQNLGAFSCYNYFSRLA